MKLLVLGDSISNGNYYDGENWHIADPRYCDILAKSINTDVYDNLAVSGASYSPLNPTCQEHNILSKSSIKAGYDVVVVFGGTNDFGNDGGVPLGDIQTTNVNTFAGAVDQTFRNIKEKNPKALIFVMLPIYRESGVNKNNVGFVLEDYRNMLIMKANKYGFNIIDGREAPFDARNKEDKEKYVNDGLHPNQEAHYIFGEFVSKKVKEKLD